MRMKRLFGGVLSAALLGLVPVALSAAPAQAATYETRVTAQMSYTTVEAGRDISITGNTEYFDGSTWRAVPSNYESSPTASTAGAAVLQRKLAGSSTWTTIEVDSSAGSFYFYPVRATQNATYRVVFNALSKDGHVYPANGAEGKLTVLRKIDVKTKYGSLKVTGKVSPEFKKKKLVVQVKKGKWKTWKKVKTNNKGKYAVKLVGSRNGTKYRFVAPGSKKFAKTTSGIITATAYRF